MMTTYCIVWRYCMVDPANTNLRHWTLRNLPVALIFLSCRKWEKKNWSSLGILNLQERIFTLFLFVLCEKYCRMYITQLRVFGNFGRPQMFYPPKQLKNLNYDEVCVLISPHSEKSINRQQITLLHNSLAYHSNFKEIWHGKTKLKLWFQTKYFASTVKPWFSDTPKHCHIHCTATIFFKQKCQNFIYKQITIEFGITILDIAPNYYRNRWWRWIGDWLHLIMH